MNETFDTAIKFLEENSTALLTTVIRANCIDSRLIGPFVNDGLTVYIFTLNGSNKVCQITENPHVSLYVQNKFENTREYRSLVINGRAIKVSNDKELISAKEKLGIKSKGYKEWIDRDGWEKWTILKVQPEILKYTDNQKLKTPQIIEIKNNDPV